MEELSHIRLACRYLRALGMLPVVCAATLSGQVPPGALVINTSPSFLSSLRFDSYDSADPVFSSGGRYDPAKFKANGDIRSSSPVTVGGNSAVFGRVWAPVAICSGSSRIGDISWVLSGQKGIQPGWVQPGTPFQFEDVAAPYPDAPQPFGGVVVIRGVTNSFGGILGNGDYLVLTNTPLAVTGVASLFAPNGFSGSISVAPGARLNMYVGAGLVLNGAGTNAQADFAKNLVVYCLPTVTNVSLNNGGFTGIIYAPQANVVLSGYEEIFGSVAARTASTFGTTLFHYDEQISHWYPPMPAAIASARFVSGAGFQFDVLGSPGLNYVLQTSTNLTDWIPSSTNAAPFTYTDPDASFLPNRFYRASWAR